MKISKTHEVNWSEVIAPEEPLQVVGTLIKLWPFVMAGFLGVAIGEVLTQILSPNALVDLFILGSGAVSGVAIALTMVLLLINVVRIANR